MASSGSSDGFVAAGERDLRLPLLGVFAWTGGLLAAAAQHRPRVVAVLTAVIVVGAVTAGVRQRGLRATAAAAIAVLLAVLAVAGFRVLQVRHDPVAQLAAQGAEAEVVAVVTSDPRTVVEAHATQQLVRVQIRRVTGRGRTFAVRAPAILLGDSTWADVPLGTTVATSGRLVAADEADVAALLLAREPPRRTAAPGIWWRASSALRASVRASATGRPEARAILPALVDGDESGSTRASPRTSASPASPICWLSPAPT